MLLKITILHNVIEYSSLKVCVNYISEVIKLELHI